MKINKLLAAGAAILTSLVLAGCSKESPSTAATESAASAPASGAGGGGSAAPVARPVAPVARPVVIPEGTALVVRSAEALSTKTHTAGQAFTANLEQALVVDGREIAPKGAQVEGKIVSSDDGGRVKGRASIAVQLTSLTAGSGRTVEISTDSVTRVARGTKAKDATKVGIGSGVGAAIGAIAGGGKGAAIGAAAGAGAGGGLVLATKGDPAVIASESVLTFSLRAPATVSR
jgi:hypothetical protein